jgi:site-specific DNA recombinase
MMEEKFKKGKTTKAAQDRELDAQIAKLSTRLQNAKEMMLDGEMERIEYKQIVSELEPEIEKLKRKKAAAGTLEDDYQRYLKGGLCLLKNIAERFEKASLEKRQQIVGVIFPDKLVYDSGTYRTTTLHAIFEVITATEAALGGNKKRKGQHFADLSFQVVLTGLKVLCSVETKKNNKVPETLSYATFPYFNVLYYVH